MLAGLESDRYMNLLNTLEAATVSLVVRAVDDDLESGAARRFRKLRKAVKRLGSPPEDEDLHRVRRQAKKARYTADLVKPRGGKKVEKYLAAIKELQEVLGDFQDAVVAQGRITGYLPEARTTPEGFALGRMAELQASKKRRAAAAFPSTWERVAKAGKKAWR
jgi:CHAD domain-containing protein